MVYLLEPSSVAPKNVWKIYILIYFLVSENAFNNESIQVRLLTCRLTSAEPIKNQHQYMNTQIHRYLRYFVKFGHSGVFQVKNCLITVDTTKYVCV